jgi:hypothetical protein
MKKQEMLPLFLSIKKNFSKIRSSQTIVEFIKQKSDDFYLMTNKLLVILFLFCLLISCNDSKKQEIGVWANKDCELIKTENFVLFFERTGNQISATFENSESVGDKKICKLIGKTVFKDSIVLQKYINFQLDSAIENRSIGEVTSDNMLTINMNGKVQNLDLIEKIEIVDSYEMEKVSNENIGLCLQQWRLGTRLTVDKNNNSIEFELGTNKHSYLFVIQDGIIYCRAARIRSNNKGTCFAQNIRLMSDGQESTRYMIDDNKKTSSDELKIDDSKFDPTKCVFDKEAIYWSFIKFNKDTILLNGCGEIYSVPRESKTSKTIKEWIGLVKY